MGFNVKVCPEIESACSFLNIVDSSINILLSTSSSLQTWGASCHPRILSGVATVESSEAENKPFNNLQNNLYKNLWTSKHCRTHVNLGHTSPGNAEDWACSLVLWQSHKSGTVANKELVGKFIMTRAHTHTAAWNVRVYRFPHCQPSPASLLLISDMFGDGWAGDGCSIFFSFLNKESAFWHACVDRAHWLLTLPSNST